MAFSFRQLKYFVATAETGQVSQAAIQLCITQSAVTAAIRQLEEVLATSLFVRHPQGMVLTDCGRHFLGHAYEILANVEEAMLLGKRDGDFAGRLTVAASYTVMGYFLPAHVCRLSALYPQLRIELFELSREDIEAGLLRQDFDVAVLLTSNVDNPALRLEPIISSPRRLWLPAQHPLLSHPAPDLQDIAEQPYIMLTVDEAEQTTWRYWQQSPWQPQVRVRTSSVEAVRSMVANGSGVSILSDMVFRPWSLEGRRIDTVSLHGLVPPMTLGLAWKAGSEVSPAIALFRDYFRQQFMSPASSQRSAAAR
ncbi:LysR family transcriptional regulator [Aquitalea sp. ASV11]|uniref:LysR family transcriptional regulator n=1 Tax=Aquitalea sp. ASV11 TaxID=2795103 RepID=UPI0018EB81F8|nr:LysR family transcriptional regulator [Aquitalea sp. ASV11]